MMRKCNSTIPTHLHVSNSRNILSTSCETIGASASVWGVGAIFGIGAGIGAVVVIGGRVTVGVRNADCAISKGVVVVTGEGEIVFLLFPERVVGPSLGIVVVVEAFPSPAPDAMTSAAFFATSDVLASTLAFPLLSIVPPGEFSCVTPVICFDCAVSPAASILISSFFCPVAVGVGAVVVPLASSPLIPFCSEFGFDSFSSIPSVPSGSFCESPGLLLSLFPISMVAMKKFVKATQLLRFLWRTNHRHISTVEILLPSYVHSVDLEANAFTLVII